MTPPEIALPATALEGCVVIANFAALPAEILKA